MPARQRDRALVSLRQFAIEALAIHHEHRARDLRAARELALFALEEETASPRADGMRHRLARLDGSSPENKTPSSFSELGAVSGSEDPGDLNLGA